MSMFGKHQPVMNADDANSMWQLKKLHTHEKNK